MAERVVIGNAELWHGDALEVLPLISQAHAVVTDPPYGLSFMGRHWDYDVPEIGLWRMVLAAMLPGAHLLSFAGNRTQHRMAVNIEDAGFEIRDMIAWVYGSGFPKSLDVSKAIDRAAGAKRFDAIKSITRGTPRTPAARQWAGWGTALKPAMEPITVARKPISERTVAANVLAHGTGAINIDGCRVACDNKAKFPAGVVSNTEAVFGGGNGLYADRPRGDDLSPTGRWPANLVHDGSDEVVGLFPVTPGATSRTDTVSKGMFHGGNAGTVYADTGSAASFFYCAKANKADRDEGCEGLEENRNHHPTVKPTALMRYLCRLVTPPGGTVLDPFMGSGSTGKAAVLEGFKFIGIEREREYFEIACARIARAQDQGQLL